jgi:hypothetical protein
MLRRVVCLVTHFAATVGAPRMGVRFHAAVDTEEDGLITPGLRRAFQPYARYRLIAGGPRPVAAKRGRPGVSRYDHCGGSRTWRNNYGGGPRRWRRIAHTTTKHDAQN